MGKVIIVEGIIGAGKTTFSKLLAESLGGNWLKEPDEQNGNPYLSKFYETPTRWALTMQLHLLNTRFRMHKYAQWTALQSNKCVVLDRSYFGDTAFARLQLQNKTMTLDEYQTYTMSYHNMTSSVLLPQICVYLKTSPEVSQQRIKTRMEHQTGRKCEDVIDLKYLQDLDVEEDLVIDTLKKQGVYIIHIDWNDNLSFECIQSKVDEVCKTINEYTVPDVLLDLHRRTV